MQSQLQLLLLNFLAHGQQVSHLGREYQNTLSLQGTAKKKKQDKLWLTPNADFTIHHLQEAGGGTSLFTLKPLHKATLGTKI